MLRNRTFALLLTALPLAACSRAEHTEPAAQSAAAPAPGAVAENFTAPAAEMPAAVEAAVPSTAPAPEQPAQHGPAASAEPAAAPQAKPAPAEPVEKGTESPASTILARVEKTYAATRSMQATFVQDLSVPLLGTSQKSRGTLYQRQPDRFAMKFSDPAGDVLVADGRYFWMYYPSSDRTQVIRSKLAAGAGQVDFQKEFLHDAESRYRVSVGAQEPVAGGAADVLTLTPKAQSPYQQIRIWVSRSDALVRRFEMTEQNGSVRRIELSDVKRNQPIADAVFRFTPPEGAQVFDQ